MKIYVPPIKLQGIKTKLVLDIKNLSNEVLDAFSVYRKEQGYLKPTEIQIYRNGKREVYESRALRLAAGGDYRAAIRELLLGSMSWLERSALIRFRRGLTNRDYYRSIWRRPEKRQAWIATASQFELVYFGRRQPTQEMFETCLIEFQGAFREEESPTVSV